MSDAIHYLIRLYLMHPISWIIGITFFSASTYFAVGAQGAAIAILTTIFIITLPAYARRIEISSKKWISQHETEEAINKDAHNLADLIFKETSENPGSWIDMRTPGDTYILENVARELIMDSLVREKIVEQRSRLLDPLRVRLTTWGREVCRSRLNPTNINIKSEATGMNSRVDGTYNIGNSNSIINSQREVQDSTVTSTSTIGHQSPPTTSDHLKELAKSLRIDAQGADEFQRDLALAHANEADRLAADPDESRIGKFLGQLSGFVDFASSGFALTKEILQT